MTRSTARSMTARITAPLLTGALLVLVGLVSGGALAPTPANADVPDPQYSAPFNAERCEGATDNDPTAAEGPVPDLTLVFGQRLVDYNNGQVVHLYDSEGRNGSIPSCTVRHVDGVGPVSEWSYCTNRELHTCTFTTEDGSLLSFIPSPEPDYPVPNPVPGLQSIPGNPKLTVEQARLVAYIIRNPLPIVDDPGGASNANYQARFNRQKLVWCISNPNADNAEGTLRAWCAANMPPAEQQRILALVPEQAELNFALTSESTTLVVGDTAHMSLTTNVYNQPIPLSIVGGDVTVCEGDASLENGVLTVAGTDAAVSTTIGLCVTSTTEGTVTVSGTATPTTFEQISWVQSDPECQVFATFESTQAPPVSSTATVQFGAAVPQLDATGDAGRLPISLAGVLILLAGTALLVRRTAA